MRKQINLYAHKYLPEILVIFSVLLVFMIIRAESQRGQIKTNTEKTLSNQELSMKQDSIAYKDIEAIGDRQDEFIQEAQKLRQNIKK